MELHVVQLFRCSLCNGDYVSKEGLWNHLDLHEIADECKEFNYQKMKATRMHQCVLCNDQRAYSESLYWKHVRDVHDGFFLRCSDCGENFRSKQHKNDHASSRCKARVQAVASALNAVQKEPGRIIKVIDLTSDAEHLKLLRRKLENRLRTDYASNNMIGKKPKLPTINLAKSNGLPPRFACEICGATFSSFGILLRHQRAKYACTQGSQQKCPHCRRVFNIKEYQAHFSLCEKKQFSCELCPAKYDTSDSLKNHMSNVHRDKGVLRNKKQDQNYVNILSRTINLAVKVDSNVAEGRNINKDTDKDIADESVQLLFETPSSSFSGTKCANCDKEFASSSDLHQHDIDCHQLTMCNICGSIFQGYSNALHHKIMRHSEPKYECDKCSMEFHCIKLYERHSNDCDPTRSDSSHKNSGELVPKDRSDPNDSQVIDKESPVLSVAPSNGSSERQVVSEKTLESIVENQSNHPYSCNICGITLSSYPQISFHKLTRHAEGTYQCPHCSRKFHFKYRLDDHVLCCADLKHSCELCGQKFILQSTVEDHKKRVHPGSRPLRNANTEGAECTEEQRQTSVEKTDAAQEMISCISCRTTFASTDELTKHKLSCPNDAKGHDDSQFGAKEVSLLHGVKGTQADSTIVPQDEDIDLELEIEVEVTMLSEQEQEHQVPNEDPRRSSATTTLVSAEQLEVSQLSCPKDAKSPDDSQFGAREISLLHGVKGTQTDSTIVPQDEDIDLKLEIEVEVTMLQEQEHQVPNEDPRRSFATTTLVSAEQLKVSQISCPKQAKQHDNSQFGAKEISLLHDVRGTRTDSTIVSQEENIDLKLEIKVEETMLQEQEYQVPNENPGGSSDTALIRIGSVPTMTHQEQQRISKHQNHFQGGQQQLQPERRDSASSEEFHGFSEDEIRRGRKLKYVGENSTSANEILTDLTARRSRRFRKARIEQDFLY